MIPVFISFLLIAIYIIYAIIDKGVPHSLSSTYYDYGWKFSLITTLSAALILPDMIYASPDEFEPLAFVTLCGAFFVAFAPNFKSDSLTDAVHTWAAVIALIASLIWVGAVEPLNLLWWIPVLCYIGFGIYSKRKILELPKIKFIAEVVMLLTIYASLI